MQDPCSTRFHSIFYSDSRQFALLLLLLLTAERTPDKEACLCLVLVLVLVRVSHAICTRSVRACGVERRHFR